ncbi:enoyl-CoA hydratase/isomerase family protein [Sphingomonas sp. IC-56]|uniref:enoyl-CoA hydratase/isomerase family protein n=1 Tax=Sphingomonas sp. IC-56 TaxID=2898529 RepID=UPI001E30E399|nr:enoyl-CoA hydratase/isomerase family protein [Sphingomonas sp. IC-56]MCD2324930.1 enoyl-CoA hydratase/isomerase family protein [Sphingomonas sp. IC-56]
MIRVTHDGPIATITLDRAEARNALPIAGWDALGRAAMQVGEARVVILCSGISGIFCAGADIAEFARLQANPAVRPRFREAMRQGIEAIAALPMPVIAAVDSGCFGAGVALTLAADIRVGGDDAVFAVTPARLGIGYPQEDVARLVAQVGRGRAAAMLFSAQRLDADAAERAGLVEVRAASAIQAAHALASAITDNAPQAVRLLKRTLRGGAELDREFDDAFGGDEFAEGLAAFQHKRSPRFQ